MGGSRRIHVEDSDKFIAELDDAWARGTSARRPDAQRRRPGSARLGNRETGRVSDVGPGAASQQSRIRPPGDGGRLDRNGRPLALNQTVGRLIVPGNPEFCEELAMIDWNSPHWGESGHNVHHSANGSWWDESEDRWE